MNSQLANDAGTPSLNTYIDDLQSQPITLGPGDYWNIALLEYKLIWPTQMVIATVQITMEFRVCKKEVQIHLDLFGNVSF